MRTPKIKKPISTDDNPQPGEQDLSLPPLVVSIAGQSELVAAFQLRMVELMQAFSLDAVVDSYSVGGVSGFSSLQWVLGFQPGADFMISGEPGASFAPYVYDFPKVDLLAAGGRILRSAAIKKAIAVKKRQEDDLLIGVQLTFGELAPTKRKRGRPKKEKSIT